MGGGRKRESWDPPHTTVAANLFTNKITSVFLYGVTFTHVILDYTTVSAAFPRILRQRKVECLACSADLHRASGRRFTHINLLTSSTALNLNLETFLGFLCSHQVVA